LPILLTVLAISLVYMAAAEGVKRVFYRRQRSNRASPAPGAA
jgi:P-type Mg2+ transporter